MSWACKFFFACTNDAKRLFPKAFGIGVAPSKYAACAEKKRLGQTYGFYHAIQTASERDPLKALEINQMFLTSFLKYLAYMSDYSHSEEKQFEFDQRKNK